MGQCTAHLTIGGHLDPSQYAGLMGVCEPFREFLDDNVSWHADLQYFEFVDNQNWDAGFAEIETYCESVRIPYRLDITNQDVGSDYTVIYNPFSRGVELHGIRPKQPYTLMWDQPIMGFDEIADRILKEDLLGFWVLKSHYEEPIPELQIPHLGG